MTNGRLPHSSRTPPARVAGLSLEELAAAGVTALELQALRLWRPGERGGGYGSVALALDISPEAVRNRIKRAIVRLERHKRLSQAPNEGEALEEPHG